MSIHVSIGYKDGMTGPYVEVINKSFVTSEAAVTWWEDVDFNSPSVLEVLNAAKHEYVGTEHEIMTANTRRGETGYTNLWCCIEGQEGKDTFDDRFRDLYVTEVIYMGGSNGFHDLQLNGHDTENKRVWQS